MNLVKPSIEFLHGTKNPLIEIEAAGRTCYKSEDKIDIDSASKFVEKLVKRGHFAMIEHAWASYRVITDRGVTHEIVRHRLFSYAQESTRYCNYKGGVTFIIPPWLKCGRYIQESEYDKRGSYDIVCIKNGIGVPTNSDVFRWLSILVRCENTYKELLHKRWTPQEARSVLPNALKTEIVVTGNLREWLHFLTLRTAKTAHPQIQEIAFDILVDIKKRVPIIFDNIEV